MRDAGNLAIHKPLLIHLVDQLQRIPGRAVLYLVSGDVQKDLAIEPVKWTPILGPAVKLEAVRSV